MQRSTPKLIPIPPHRIGGHEGGDGSFIRSDPLVAQAGLLGLGLDPLEEFLPDFIGAEVLSQDALHPGFEVIETVHHRGDVRCDIVVDAEVRWGDALEVDLGKPLDALAPGFQMELRRHGRDAHVGFFARPGDADTADIAGETNVFEVVDYVVAGVSGHVQGRESQVFDDDFIVVIKHVDAFFGHGEHISPEGIHLVAVDALGAA